MIASRKGFDAVWKRTTEEVIADLEKLREQRKGVWPQGVWLELAVTIADLKRGKRFYLGKAHSGLGKPATQREPNVPAGDSLPPLSANPSGPGDAAV
jgi:hypothetical protein